MLPSLQHLANPLEIRSSGSIDPVNRKDIPEVPTRQLDIMQGAVVSLVSPTVPFNSSQENSAPLVTPNHELYPTRDAFDAYPRPILIGRIQRNDTSSRLTNVSYSSPEAAAAIHARMKTSREALAVINRHRRAGKDSKRLASQNAFLLRTGLSPKDRKSRKQAKKRAAGIGMVKKAWHTDNMEEILTVIINQEASQKIPISDFGRLGRRSGLTTLRMAILSPISSLISRMRSIFCVPSLNLRSCKLQPQVFTSLKPPEVLKAKGSVPIVYAQDKQSSSRAWGFAGSIIIQSRRQAMIQALSDDTPPGPQEVELRTSPLFYHSDAAVSKKDNLTGLAVVSKSRDQKWITQGYRIYLYMEQTDAETWAIERALDCALDEIRSRTSKGTQHACKSVVIYSDCTAALRRISRNFDADVVQRIIGQSLELKQLGIDVELHWVPGHSNVLGNELADMVAKRARLPAR